MFYFLNTGMLIYISMVMVKLEG